MLLGEIELLLAAGGAVGDSGLGKWGGGDLATGVLENWHVRDRDCHGYTWLLPVPDPQIFPPMDQIRQVMDISMGKTA